MSPESRPASPDHDLFERFCRAGLGPEDFDEWAAGQPELQQDAALADDLRREIERWDAVVAELAGGLFEDETSPLEGDPGGFDPLIDFQPRAGKRVGDYVLRRKLGAGSFGQVWEAEEESLARRVALKLVRPDRVDELTLERFGREARAGGRVQHGNLVTTFAHGTSDGVSWIAQELVEGARTLFDLLTERRAADALPRDHDRSVAMLVSAVADGMQAAHDVGVVHRDLKPQNILLDRSGAPKVTDFGLARVEEDLTLSVSGQMMGTLQYMAPEQMQGQLKVDGRADVYSLGAVFYELLTLQPPQVASSVRELILQVQTADVLDARKLRPRCPRDLAVIAAKALEKDPARRYAGMAELAADLRRFLRHEPIVVRPPAAPVRAAKWVRRNPVRSVAAAAATLLAGVLLTGFATLAEQRAETRDGQLRSLATFQAAARWADSLGLVGQLRESGGRSDSEEQTLDWVEARSLLASNRHGEARPILERLASDDAGADPAIRHGAALHAAWLDLAPWIALGEESGREDPFARIQELPRGELSPADDAVVAALLARHTADALEAYELALSHQAVHYIADISRLQLLFWSGHLEEFEAAGLVSSVYFPADETLDSLRYLHGRIAGDVPAAESTGKPHLDVGVASLRSIERVGTFLGHLHAARSTELPQGTPPLGGAQWLFLAVEESPTARGEELLRVFEDQDGFHSILGPTMHHLGPVYSLLFELTDALNAQDMPRATAAALGISELHSEGWLDSIQGVLRMLPQQIAAGATPSFVQEHVEIMLEAADSLALLEGHDVEAVLYAGTLAAMLPSGASNKDVARMQRMLAIAIDDPDVPLQTLQSILQFSVDWSPAFREALATAISRREEADPARRVELLGTAGLWRTALVELPLVTDEARRGERREAIVLAARAFWEQHSSSTEAR